MSFTERINTTPANSNFNYFTDYIELLVMASENNEVSTSELYERFRSDRLGRIKDIKTFSDIKKENQSLADAEESDLKLLQVSDLIGTCLERVNLYGPEMYPFVFTSEGENKTLKLKETLNESHYIYLYLLLASNLKYTREDMSSLTTNFEKLCINSFQTFLPQGQSIIYCGKGNDLNREIFPSNGAFEKINVIASLLNLELNPDCKAEDFYGSSGDAGIDIFGFIGQEDNLPGTFLIFAQCACGEEFIDKQIEAHQIETTSKFRINFNHATILFTPKNFRSMEQDWYTKYRQKSIYYDRFRILSSLNLSDLSGQLLDEIQSKVRDYLNLQIQV